MGYPSVSSSVILLHKRAQNANVIYRSESRPMVYFVFELVLKCGVSGLNASAVSI